MTHETKITELRIKCESFVTINKTITNLRVGKVSEDTFLYKMKEINNDYLMKKDFAIYKSLVKEY